MAQWNFRMVTRCNWLKFCAPLYPYIVAKCCQPVIRVLNPSFYLPNENSQCQARENVSRLLSAGKHVIDVSKRRRTRPYNPWQAWENIFEPTTCGVRWPKTSTGAGDKIDILVIASLLNPTHFYFLQVQSFMEYFQSDCTDPIAWLNAPNYFTAITEGWAAYSEDELYPNYTTLYTTEKDKEILRQRYGMLYYQVSL